MKPRRFSIAWVRQHADHFLISTVVSIAVTFTSNIVIHHMPTILGWLHVPQTVTHWLGY